MPGPAGGAEPHRTRITVLQARGPVSPKTPLPPDLSWGDSQDLGTRCSWLSRESSEAPPLPQPHGASELVPRQVAARCWDCGPEPRGQAASPGALCMGSHGQDQPWLQPWL